MPGNYKNLNQINHIKANDSKIVRLLNLLEDDKSKKTLLNLLKYRISWNPNDIKPCISNNRQYFEQNIVKLDNNEVFIDAGAYDGDTILNFIEETGNEFEKIYAFEPEENNYYNLSKKINKLNKGKAIKLKKAGIYNENKKIGFIADKQYGSYIDSQNSNLIDVIKLDDYIKDPITFIKIDIEGVERKAILGAKQLITKNKPKLAISIYHKSQDLWELPLLIKKLVPEYKIYIRHYRLSLLETVCYAVL